MRQSRREFLAWITRLAVACPIASLHAGDFAREACAGTGPLIVADARAGARKSAGKLDPFTREALFYKKLPKGRVQCTLCPRACKVGNLERGYCGVRENRNGVYYTLVYGNPCALHVDPIEKKPFLHFLPTTRVLSLSTAGCNMNCSFCQNWEISQSRPEHVDFISLPPSEVVEEAVKTGSASIAGTYAEPTVYFEYMMAIAKEARRRGVRTVVVSAGYIEKEPLQKLCRSVDAIKIDLKGFTEEFYRKNCVATLKPVLSALKTIKESGVWLEIVNLVIPSLNDGEKDLAAMCRWIAGNLGISVPVHFSRFIPMYRLKNLPPTPVRTLERAREIAKSEGLQYAYIGNVHGHPGESTACPKCGKIIIARAGFTVKAMNLRSGKCAFCGVPIPGIWK
jgi:pyruvate formate lyase activating enzyme